MGLRSGWPVWRSVHVAVSIALVDVRRRPLVCVRRRMISSNVLDESLVYP